MSVWVDLIARELFFLALLVGFGSGPATFLSERFDGVARLALAPVFGLCVGVCATVTLLYFFPTSVTWWVLIPMALASLWVAVWRRGRAPRWPGRRGLIQLAVVAIVLLASFDYALALRHTVGPAGGYVVFDTSGYVTEANAEARESIHRAEHTHPPFSDLTMLMWSELSRFYQQLDVTALESNVNQMLGLGATDTDSPFLIVVILVGGLGVFGVVRSVSGGSNWGATLGGCLFAGPLFVELFIDGSQAALTGCALLGPMAALGWEALWSRRPATLVLFALLIAGLQTLYPLFLPSVVLGAAVAIGVLVIRRLRRGLPDLNELRLAAGHLAMVCGLAAVFTPVAFARNVRYWEAILKGSQPYPILTPSRLPLDVLPGWVLQTRELYGLVDLGHATAFQLVMGALLPVLLLAVIVLALRRHREALIMLAVAVGASLLAYYTSASIHCTYCEQRNMIPVAALAPPALGLGVVAIATSRWRGRLLVAVPVAAVILVAVGYEGVIERERMVNGSGLMNTQTRQAIAALPRNSGPVEVEGFGQGDWAAAEEPLVYNLVDEKTNGNLSLPTDRDDTAGLAYLGGIQPLGPAFKPDYRYVLTRLAGISTNRRVVARYGAIALEKRTQPLDVTIDSGVLTPAAWQDPTGTAWLSPWFPMHFVVSGGSPGSRAWLSVVLKSTGPVTLASGVKQQGVAVTSRHGITWVCARVPGEPPVRVVGVHLSWGLQAPPAVKSPFAPPLPPRGARIISMDAQATPCSPAPD